MKKKKNGLQITFADVSQVSKTHLKKKKTKKNGTPLFTSGYKKKKTFYLCALILIYLYIDKRASNYLIEVDALADKHKMGYNSHFNTRSALLGGQKKKKKNIQSALYISSVNEGPSEVANIAFAWQNNNNNTLEYQLAVRKRITLN